MASESKSLLAIPKWDRIQTSAGIYILKMETLLEYHDSRDAIGRVVMQNCLMKAEYDILGTTDANNIKKAVIGQETDHGLAVITKMKTDGHPYGLAYEVIETTKQENKPMEMSTDIEMEAELSKV